MEQIKIKIKNELFFIAKKFGPEAERNILQNSKSLKRFMSLKSFNENESQLDQNEIKEKKHKKRKQSTKISSIKLQTIEEKEENSPFKTNIDEEVNINTKENNLTEKIENNSSKKNNYKIFHFNSTNINNNTIKECENFMKSGNQIKEDNKSDIDNEESTNSKKEEKKDSDIKSPSDTPSSNSIETKKINTIQDEMQEFNKENKDSNKNIKKKIVKHISMPLNFNVNNDKNSNMPQITSISIKKSKQSVITKSENLYYPSFSNLSTTVEKSFELISSYENLNKITNNIYMKNLNLQSKTKKFLINECSSLGNDSQKEKLRIRKNPLNGKKIIRKRNTKRLTSDYKIEKDNNSVNSLDLTKLPSKKNIEKINELTNIDKKHEIKNRRHESVKNLLEKKQSKSNINIIDIINKKYTNTNTKIKRKSDINVNKKLNLISKNIQGANKNINNPEEFYMDFFNNIIKQKTGVVEKSEDKNNSNKILNENPSEKIQKNYNNEKNSPNHKKNNSIISGDSGYRKKKINKKSTKSNCQFQS